VRGDKPKVFASAKLAWSDVFRIVADMPTLALGAVALGVVFGVVHVMLVRWTGRVPLTFGALLAQSAVSALWVFFLTPVYLAIHRYIILGEVASGYTLAFEQPRFQRFFLYTLALYAIWLVPSLLLAMLGPGGVTIAAILILSLIGTFVSTRLIILFPAIAVDAPGTSFGNAFDDTKGCFWRIFGILLVATLPIIAAAIIIALSLGPQSTATTLISAVLNMLTMALAIAIASRLYLNLSDRLGRPTAGAVEIGTA
jgi:hypothetical protein